MENKRRFQFSLRTLALFVLAFALGFAARNLASGLHALSLTATLPSSTSLVAPGDVLLVESFADDKLNRRVTVLADGTVALPLVGTLAVGGQDIASVEKAVTKSYQQFYREPGIQVFRTNASKPLVCETNHNAPQ